MLVTIVVGGYLLFQVNAGDFGVNQILNTMVVGGPEVGDTDIEQKPALFEISETPEKPEKVVNKTAYAYYTASGVNVEEVENTEKFNSHVYGAIVPPSELLEKELSVFFSKLKNSQSVDTFVVIGENHSLRGNFEIASSKYGYETDYGNVEPHIELVDTLIDENPRVGISYGAFSKEKSISNMMPYIELYFPEAKVVSISVKDFASDKDLEDLATTLAKNLGDNDVVIASTVFSEQMNSRVTAFHDELSINVLETFDLGGIDQMDVDSRPVLYGAMSYLEKVGAQSVEITKNIRTTENSNIFAVFHSGEPSENRKLTITAFGDMMLGRYVRTLMESNGMDYIFENIRGYENRFFEGADVVFGNLEGPIKGLGRSGGTSMVFGFNEDIAPFLKKYGFNLFSLANNHATDQGWDGRDTTIEALEKNDLGWCGHPSEADYGSVHYSKVGDKNYAFLCFHDVTYKLNDDAAIELIKKIRPNVDYLIVSIHWGYEYKHTPDWNTEISPGRNFIDAGADFVIGHHPHVVQSFEIYNGKPIFYSLGNFVFDQYWSTETQEELAIGIVLDDGGKMSDDFSGKVYLFPMKSEKSQSRLLNDSEYKVWIEEFLGYGDYSEETKRQIRAGVIEF